MVTEHAQMIFIAQDSHLNVIYCDELCASEYLIPSVGAVRIEAIETFANLCGFASWRESAHPKSPRRQGTRSYIETVIQISPTNRINSLMQIEVMTIDGLEILQSSLCIFVLVRPHADVYVAVRTQCGIGVATRN